MVRLDLATPVRRTRRRKRGRHGEHMDMRRTLRNSLKTGGDPIKLARRRRRVQKRRLVLLCDISGSMEPYARAYLQFLHCARASGPDHEAFVFATRLTRLTKQLAGRNPQRAIRRATESVEDWSSGTRIGDALKSFNDRYGRRGMARGSVIVILSDGWERGDPEMVSREMERLARLAYRIVWVNPRVSAPGFQPKAGGLVAALPYCNALVSGHNLNALDEVADAIAADHDDDALGTAAGSRRRWTATRRSRAGASRARARSASRCPPTSSAYRRPRQDRARAQLVGRQRRRLRDGPMMPLLAHIVGIPLEETLAMAAPVMGAICAALMATLPQRRAAAPVAPLAASSARKPRAPAQAIVCRRRVNRWSRRRRR